MAKAKSGGTRALLRGRVASDVYSIGKDAKGNKQQIVRSLAESVANPQTILQMRGRMIMSTVMQAVSAMSAIIDHSFDAYPAGQPNISEFIRQNYALIKADVAAHPTSGNAFGLNKYGEKGVKQGAYVVAAGSAADIAGVVVDNTAKTLTIALSAGATIADLRNALGLGTDDYFTYVALTDTSKFLYIRFHVSATLSAATAITADNIGDIIATDGNISASVAFSSNNVVLTLADATANYGIIVSRKQNAEYKHNNVVLAAVENPVYASDDALPTYPTGAQRFLNGGGEEAAPFSPEPEPEPETPVIELSSLTTNGNAAIVGGWVNMGSNPTEETEYVTCAFNAVNVSEVGGAAAYYLTSYAWSEGGTKVNDLSDGANTLDSVSMASPSSIWIKPAVGDPILLVKHNGGGD